MLDGGLNRRSKLDHHSWYNIFDYIRVHKPPFHKFLGNEDDFLRSVPSCILGRDALLRGLGNGLSALGD